MVPPLGRSCRQRARQHAAAIPSAALFAGLLLAATASVGLASDVEPIITHNNAMCDDVDGGAGWRELILRDAGKAGPHTSADGALVVTLAFHSVSQNTPTVVDWSSNIGVEGLIVRGGQTGDNFYRYSPPATGDTFVTADDLGTSQISNLNFCYVPTNPLLPDVAISPTPSPAPDGGLPNAATGPFDHPMLLAGLLILVGLGALLGLRVLDGTAARRGRE